MKRLRWICVVGLILLAGLAQAEEPKEKITCRSRYAFPGECTACHRPPIGDVGELLPPGVKRYNDTVYLNIDYIAFDRLWEKFLPLRQYKYDRLVIDLMSHGGSLFDAMGMISLIRQEQNWGKVVEIRSRGLVASAGLLILIAGTPGHRYIDPHTLVMFHELWSFKFFAIETPSDKEDEAAIFRMIQNQVNAYIVSRSKISEQELRDRIKKKEFWLCATDAIKYGFADQLLK